MPKFVTWAITNGPDKFASSHTLFSPCLLGRAEDLIFTLSNHRKIARVKVRLLAAQGMCVDHQDNVELFSLTTKLSYVQSSYIKELPQGANPPPCPLQMMYSFRDRSGSCQWSPEIDAQYLYTIVSRLMNSNELDWPDGLIGFMEGIRQFKTKSEARILYTSIFAFCAFD
jgi:hypothetical protein